MASIEKERTLRSVVAVMKAVGGDDELRKKKWLALSNREGEREKKSHILEKGGNRPKKYTAQKIRKPRISKKKGIVKGRGGGRTSFPGKRKAIGAACAKGEPFSFRNCGGKEGCWQDKLRV